MGEFYEVIYMDINLDEESGYLDDLYDFDMLDYAAESALIFLWASANNVDTAVRLLDTWGFDYETIALTYECRTETQYCIMGGVGCYKHLLSNCRDVYITEFDGDKNEFTKSFIETATRNSKRLEITDSDFRQKEWYTCEIDHLLYG